MGGYGGGFLQGLSKVAQQKIDQTHEEDQALKKEKRGMYWDIAYDTTGKYSDGQKQAAQDELGKLLGPDAKKGLSRFTDIFSKLRGSQQPGQDSGQPPMSETMPNGQPAPGTGGVPRALPTPQTAAPQQQSSITLASPPGGGAMTAQPAPMAQAPAAQAPRLPTPQTQTPQSSGLPPIQTDADIQTRLDAAAKSNTKRSQDAEAAEYDTWLKRGKDVLGESANPRDLAEFAGSKGTKLPPVAAATLKMTPVNLTMKDGQTIPAMRAIDGKYYDLQHNLLDGDAIKTEAGKISTAAPRFSGQAVTLESAIAQHKQGTKFKGIDGEELNPQEVPPGMVLQPIAYGDGVRFMPVDPSQVHISFDNQVVATDKYHEKQAGTDGTVLGAARVPTQTQRSVAAVNPVTGETTINTLPSTTTPVTGKPGSHAVPPAGSAPGASAPANGAAQSPAGIANPQSSALPPGAVLRGVPAGQYRAMLERVTPVREAATQVFGDPSQPNLKGLKDYIDLADDPKSRERLGKALRITLDGINDASHGGNVSVGAGPVAISAGGVGTWLQNVLHVPQGVASSKNDIIQGALKDLSPKELEAYDSVMSAFSTVVGLRSLTRASAAQGSVQAIERELPLIGINTQNSGQFADQMQRLAEVVYNGTKGVPAGMFDPEMVKRIQGLPAEMQKLKDARRLSGKLPTPGQGGSAQSFKQNATSSDGKTSIGSNDGVTWYDKKTGKEYK